MKLLKRIAISFSIYSKIPMPVFHWDEEDYAYNLVFFPFVGLVIGIACFLLAVGLERLEMPQLMELLLLGAVPLLITGGFHVDGFMDTVDALSSYQDREKKLEILSDPHIGAFAVIGLLTYVLLDAAGMIYIFTKGGRTEILIYSLFFFVSRCISAMTSLTFPKAKDKGMLVSEVKNVKGGKIFILALFYLLGMSTLFFLQWKEALVIFASQVLFVIYYYQKMKKEFGGVTGDTAGFFVVVSKCVMTHGLVIGMLL